MQAVVNGVLATDTGITRARALVRELFFDEVPGVLVRADVPGILV